MILCSLLFIPFALWAESSTFRINFGAVTNVTDSQGFEWVAFAQGEKLFFNAEGAALSPFLKTALRGKARHRFNLPNGEYLVVLHFYVDEAVHIPANDITVFLNDEVYFENISFKNKPNKAFMLKQSIQIENEHLAFTIASKKHKPIINALEIIPKNK